MQNIGIVIGDALAARPLVVGKNKVYVHTNIMPIENSTMYSYNEVQYDKNEYIEMMAEENGKLKNELINTQLALCEIYESMEV